MILGQVCRVSQRFNYAIHPSNPTQSSDLFDKPSMLSGLKLAIQSIHPELFPWFLYFNWYFPVHFSLFGITCSFFLNNNPSVLPPHPIQPGLVLNHPGVYLPSTPSDPNGKGKPDAPSYPELKTWIGWDC
jgi:hypothetical protein